MKKSKRLLSVLLVLCMMLTLLPVSASAIQQPITIGAVGYSTMAAALTAAVDGSIITLNNDITESVVYTQTTGSALTIDGQGHTITGVAGNESTALTLDGEGVVKLKSLTLQGGSADYQSYGLKVSGSVSVQSEGTVKAIGAFANNGGSTGLSHSGSGVVNITDAIGGSVTSIFFGSVGVTNTDAGTVNVSNATASAVPNSLSYGVRNLGTGTVNATNVIGDSAKQSMGVDNRGTGTVNVSNAQSGDATSFTNGVYVWGHGTINVFNVTCGTGGSVQNIDGTVNAGTVIGAVGGLINTGSDVATLTLNKASGASCVLDSITVAASGSTNIGTLPAVTKNGVTGIWYTDVGLTTPFTGTTVTGAAILYSSDFSSSAPTVKSGQETQTGSATPASVDGYTAAAAYAADASNWFADAEGNTLTYSVVSAAEGTNDVSPDVSISGNTVIYTPKAAQAGKAVTIEVKAYDGTADSTSNVTITVTVGAVPADDNVPAIVSGQGTQTGSATPASNDGNTAAVAYTADMSSWFSDTDIGDTLTYSVVSALDISSNDVSSDVSISGSTISYTPEAAQESKLVAIVLKANDGKADSAGNVTITVAVGSVPADGSTNHAPTIVLGQGTQNGSATPASEDGNTAAVVYTADASNWFTDSDGDTLTYSVVSALDISSNDVSADVSISGSTITYTPEVAQASKPVAIVLKANDGTADSTSNVTIFVSVDLVPTDGPVNHAPTVVLGQETQTGSAAVASYDGNTAAVAYTADMSSWFSDSDIGDTLTYRVESAVDESNNYVKVSISGNTITYTPGAAQAGNDVTIMVRAWDSEASSTGNVTITVSVAADASRYNAAVAAIPVDSNSSLYTNGSWTAFKTAIAACSLALTVADGQSALNTTARNIFKAVNLLVPINTVSLTTDGTAALGNSINSITDVKWFKFYATAGETYSIQTANLNLLTKKMGLVMYLYAPDSTTQLDFNDDINPENRVSAIDYTMSTTGTYYVKVENYAYYSYLKGSNNIPIQSDISQFDISVTQNSNTTQTAAPVIAGSVSDGDTSVVGTAAIGASVVLRVNGMPEYAVTATGGIWAVSRLALLQGDIISVTAVSAPNTISLAATVTVGGPTTFVPTTDNSITNDTATLNIIGITVVSSNTGVAAAAIDNGKIAITSVGAGRATITVTDSESHSATIAVGVTSTGTIIFGMITKAISPITDNSTANDVPTLGFIGTSAVSSNTEVATAAIVNGKIAITSVNPGTATITVSDDDSNIAEIDVTVTAEGVIKIIGCNDVPEKATYITTDGVALTNRIDPATDVDWFRFDALAGQTYCIKTSNLSADIDSEDEMDTVIYLYDTDSGTQLDFNDDYKGLASEINFTASATGTYYVKVEQFSNYAHHVDDPPLDPSEVGQYDISVTKNNNTTPTKTPVIAGPVSDGDTIVSGTAVDGAKVVLRVNGTPIDEEEMLVSSLVVATNGIWTFNTHKLELKQGDRISVTAVSSPNAISEAATATVVGPAIFAAATDNSTTNDAATLGIIGTTAVSSNIGVATAEIVNGKIAITSVGAGIATITVTDAASHSAIIPVAVAGTGAITIGTITKYIIILAPAADNSTANDAATLGIIGTTAVSSNTGVATVAIANGKIAITSVGAGTATITVTDAASHSATITVTVAETGAITIGTITKYTAPATVDGGGGASTKIPETPAVTTTKSDNYITSSVKITSTTDLKTGSATAAIKADVVTSLVDSSKKAEASGAHSIVEIKVDVSTQTKVIEVGIPRSLYNDIAGSTNSDLKINSGIGTLTFDAKAVESISGAAAGDITIRVAKVDASTLSDAVKQIVGDRPVYDFSVKVGSNVISTFGGGSVAISLPYSPKAGEDVNAIVVYYIDASNNLQTMQGAYDAVTGTVNFVTSHFSKYMIGYNKVNFKDVTATDWYSNAVSFVAARGITTGTGNGNYSPEAKLTRGQFLVMVMKAYGISADENSKDNFEDAGNTYYTGYLAAAKKLGITAGVGRNMFAPDKTITRQEMFTLLYNILKQLGELPASTTGKTLTSYSDASGIASWAKDAMTLFVGSGTISGSGDKLNPTDTTNRAEMAQVLYSLLSK